MPEIKDRYKSFGGAQMINRLREKIEDWMAAVAFAEHGDYQTARALVGVHPRAEPRKRLRPRQKDRMVARLRAQRGAS